MDKSLFQAKNALAHTEKSFIQVNLPLYQMENRVFHLVLWLSPTKKCFFHRNKRLIGGEKA